MVVGQAYAVTEGKRESGVEALPVTVASNPLVIVAKASNGSISTAMNESLTDLRADGTYDKLVAKWLTP